MLGYFIADNISSKDYGIYLTDKDVYGTAKKSFEKVDIQGKNGTVYIDKGNYENVSFNYPCLILDEFQKVFMEFVNKLINHKGYFRLEDSFQPEVFYMAKVIDSISPKKVIDEGKIGSFTIKMTRKPQKFMKCGENVLVFENDTEILNSYNQTAKPLIRIYGNGSITINSIPITVSDNNSYLDIDCELCEAYKDNLSTDMNSHISLVNGKFPVLDSGINQITISGITKYEIIPRWWMV